MLRALKVLYNLAPYLTEVTLSFSVLLENLSHHYFHPDAA